MIIIYDDECRMCQGSVEWIRRRALPGRFEFVGCQTTERSERFPHVQLRDCQSALHIILQDGRIYAGAAALPEILTGLQGWRWLERLLRTRCARTIAPHIYQWIAKNRYFLSCTLFK